MTHLIIKIKHWALFLILVCPSIVASIFSDPNKYSKSKILANIIGMIVYFFWIWSINESLIGKMKVNRGVFFTFCMGLTFICFLTFNVYTLFYGIPKSNYSSIATASVLVLTVYCIIITSQRLKSFELCRKAKFTEYFGNFVLFLVFPIGIWFLQPRINRVQI